MELKKQIIFILGMHRSGTSAIARLVNLLGFDLGENLLGSKPDNPKGYWENKGIVESHERILALLEQRWDYVQTFPEEWPNAEGIEEEKRILEAVVKDEIKGDRVVIKDPRLCLLLPLWIDICRENQWKPGVVLMLRSPDEVARSLYERDRTPVEFSALLWIKYVLDSLRHSKGCPRVVVTYDEILRDWRSVVGKVQEFGFGTLNTPTSVADSVEEFLSADLRHHVHLDVYDNNRLIIISKYLYERISAHERPDDINWEVLYKVCLNFVDYINDSHSGDLFDEPSEEPDHKGIYDELRKSKVYSASLEIDLKRSTNYVSSMQKSLTEKDTFIQSLQETLMAKESALSEKDTSIESLQNVLREKDKHAESFGSVLSKKDQYIKSLQDTLKAKDKYAETFQSVLSERDQYIESLRSTLLDKEKYIESLHAMKSIQIILKGREFFHSFRKHNR